MNIDSSIKSRVYYCIQPNCGWLIEALSSIMSSKSVTPKSKNTFSHSGTSKSKISSDRVVVPEQRWTFLTNHTHVLALIHAKPEILLREAANQVGITERAVQRIVQELEEAGYLTRERIGRRNRYSVVLQLPLRHPIESHRTIGQLLRLVNPKGSRAP